MATEIGVCGSSSKKRDGGAAQSRDDVEELSGDTAELAEGTEKRRSGYSIHH